MRRLSGKRDIKGIVQSQRGASLPLALLLFLICAMTASIVLAAGTMAAGRSSNMAESDQAYYSVVSAVNLFRDELEGHEVTVAVKATDPEGSNPSYQVLVTTDGLTATSDYNLLERAAIFLLFKNAVVEDAAGAQSAASNYFTVQGGDWSTWPSASDFSTGKFRTLNLTHSNTAYQDALDLKVDCNFNNGGDLVFTFRKAVDSAGEKDSARLSLTCETDMEAGGIESSETGSDVEIKYATIKWAPTSVEKG